MPPSFHDDLFLAYILPTVTTSNVRRPSAVSLPIKRRGGETRRPRTILRSTWTGEIDFCRCTDDAQTKWVAVPVCRVEGEENWFGGLNLWLRKGKGDKKEMSAEKGGGNGVEAKRKEETIGGKGNEENRGEEEVIDKGRDSAKSGFRWPWQKGQLEGGQAKASEMSDEGAKEKAGKRATKKLSHSDSKPGGVFFEKSTGSNTNVDNEKSKSLAWQERWEWVMSVIVPNFKKKVENTDRNDDTTTDGNSGSGNGEINHEDADTLPRSSSVRELYKPPTKNTSSGEKEMKEQWKSRWPQMPWSKEKKDNSEKKPTAEQKVEQKPPIRPRISRVPDVMDTEGKLRANQDEQRKDENTERQDKRTREKAKGPPNDEKKISIVNEDQREGLVSMLASAKPPPKIMNPPEIISIPQRDVAAIRLIFGSETFFATETLSPPGGLIFRGNLRGEPKATLAKLEERLAARLGDKYTLCLAQGEEDLRPVVVIVPTARDTRPATPWQRFMAFSVAVLTVTTIMTRGLYATLYKPIISRYYPFKGTSAVDMFFVLPGGIVFITCTAITVVILVSQLIQRIVASRHRTRIGLPYFIPSFQLGSFGAVVQLASPTPSRAALFDIALSGAATLVLLSLGVLLVGLRLSTSFPLVTPVPLPTVTNSLLIGFLTMQVPNGQILIDYGRSLIGLHPLAIIGANCLTIAALNLLPIRQLDGGRIISALYGRRTAVRASRVTVLFLLLASTKNPYYVVFLAAVTFGPWSIDRPSKNELTEPNGLRTIVGYVFMLLMISVLLPYPASKFYGTL